MRWIDYESPQTLDEAVALFQKHGPNARALAGGTDLLVQLKVGRREPDVVIDIKKIPALRAIEWDPVKGLTLGAAVPCYQIYGDERVRKHYPGLTDVVEMIGGTPIQGRASVGGNLCNASPSADSIPMLIAYRAICHIVGPFGVRHLPVEEFCLAPGKNALAPNEFLASLHLPPPAPHSGARYLRFIPRNEMDIAVVGAGVTVTLNAAGDRFQTARIALAAVAPTPLFVAEAGDALAGEPVSDDSIRMAAEMAKAAAQPIDDMRGTVAYRKHLAEVLTRRALGDAVRRARGEILPGPVHQH
ncbi:MAG: xanthine dehydrogenase family protein subunit M [Acidobacteria bacterium]|nr:xanthine dehydrogenase family protein subunit M [Acidobacteriota bacterium]